MICPCAPPSFRSRLAIVIALLLCFGVGGFFAIKALDEGTKDEPACTAIGCRSGIGVNFAGLRRALPRAAEAQLCAGAECRSLKAERSVVPSVETHWRGVPKHPHATYTADVTVLDRRGRVLLHLRQAVRLHKFEPNGHACGPTCWFAALRLDAAQRRLAAALALALAPLAPAAFGLSPFVWLRLSRSAPPAARRWFVVCCCFFIFIFLFFSLPPLPILSSS